MKKGGVNMPMLASVDVVGTLTPVLESAMKEITGMMTSFLPFIVTISVFSAGVYLVRNFIHQGTRSIG